MLLQSYEKISNKCYQRGLTAINFLRIVGTRSIKTQNNWPIVSSFNPFIPSVATGDGQEFQYLKMVFKNKTRSLVLDSIDAKTPSSFL